MEIVVAILMMAGLLWIIAWCADLTPNQRKKKAVKTRQTSQRAAAQTCPHCQNRGAVVPVSDASNAPKLLLGIFALGVWKNYRCSSCGYRW